jgi:hypothetical protein
MIAFKFNVNRSFLTASGHPITIPKRDVPHGDVEAEGIAGLRLSIILPRGERVEDSYYTLYPESGPGNSGFGPYYQLKLRGGTRVLPSYLKLGHKLLVAVHRGSHAHSGLTGHLF